MVRLIIGLAACATLALADVTFNVVGLRADADDVYGVEIDGKITKLATTKDTYPLWSANVVGVNGPLEYRYVQLGEGGNVEQKDRAVRKLPEGAAFTPNEFFDRTTTLAHLPPLPQVYENKLQQNSPFFREGFIANLFVEGDPEELKYVNTGGSSFYPDPIKVSVQYIGANENIKINDVRFKLSGQTAREYKKLAYQMKFPKKNRLLDLATLKLRNEETDATMIREKIYVDILNSLGVPAQQAAYVRLFMNGRPVGLFVAVEEMKKHWIKKVLHPDVKKVKPGALWKMNACCDREANLEWLGPTTKSYALGDNYKNILPGQNPKDDLMQDLIKFMKDLKDYNPKEVEDPIAFWEERLDLDLFLRSMAMEYLAGAWDSYWNSGSNFQMYNDPITGKWTWLPTDFDDTFGTSFENKFASYRAIPKKNEDGFSSPLAQKLIMETPQINARFETILKEIVEYVFKPDALIPRLDAYKNMIQEDVAWDRVQPRLAKGGKNEKFTAEDLTKGLGNGTKGNWGIKKWIVQRFELVQKDLKFKAPAGADTKLPIHTMTNLKSPFGIVAAQIATQSLSGNSTGNNVKGPLNVSKKVATEQAGTAVAENDKQDDKVLNAATTIKRDWAALGAALAAVVLML
ncbi:hypothetical protein EDD11_007759 [Mortierella claussenii]|nr:hypothetical protein EDD11_007759 [Mortierella claussenii]